MKHKKHEKVEFGLTLFETVCCYNLKARQELSRMIISTFVACRSVYDMVLTF